MLDKAIFQHLKSGHLLYIRQGKTSGILGKPSTAAMQELEQKNALDPVILLPEQGLLQSYVQEVPELAWELIEYSEKSLELILPQARSLHQYALKEGGRIAIRIEAKGEFHKMLYSMGKPLLLLRFSSHDGVPPLLSPDIKILNLP